MLKNILFERSKFELREASTSELNRLVSILKENPTLVIKLNGYTDNQGNGKLNRELSENRVKEVKKYLSTHSILAKRIQTEGFGSENALNKNLTDNERRANRRVELEIISVN